MEAFVTPDKDNKVIRFQFSDAAGGMRETVYRHNTSQSSWGERAVGTMFGAKAVRVARYPQDAELLEQVAHACASKGIKNMPKVLVAPSNVINAASISGNAFMFTSAIPKSMNKGELDAVIGHELAHHRHSLRDMWTKYAVFVGAELLFDSISIGLMMKYRDRIPDRVRFLKSPYTAAVAGHYLIDAVPMALYTRQIEYEADREGAEYAGANNMISALNTLEGEVATLRKKQDERPFGERIQRKILGAIRTVLYPIPDHASTEARTAAIEKHRSHCDRLAAEETQRASASGPQVS